MEKLTEHDAIDSDDENTVVEMKLEKFANVWINNCLIQVVVCYVVLSFRKF